MLNKTTKLPIGQANSFILSMKLFRIFVSNEYVHCIYNNFVPVLTESSYIILQYLGTTILFVILLQNVVFVPLS